MAQAGEGSAAAGRDTTVFFSYSRTDQARALPIIRLLEAAGFAVWWDGVLEAGVQYIETTEQALETAEAVVVLWSRTSIASNWVRDEAMTGRTHSCLIPLSLDGSQPPLGFRQFQVLDFAGWNGRPNAPVAQELVRAVAALHGREPRLPAPAGPLAGARATRRTLLYLGGAVGVTAAGAGLWRWLGSPAAPIIRSLAVLPFRNDSADPQRDYLANGIANELRAKLARNSALQVVARSTSEVVAARGLDAVGMAAELGAAFIIEGAVQVSGDVLSVSASLVDGESGIDRMSETYRHTVDGLIEVQEDLVTAISSALSLELRAADARLQLGAATNPVAADEALRGQERYSRATNSAAYLEALEHFIKAASLDAGFAGAWTGQAEVLTSLGHSASTAANAARYYARAQAAARKAIELGPDLAEAHSQLAMILFQTQLQAREAREPYEKSVELGSGDSAIQARVAEYEALTGHDEAGREAARIAMVLDPLNPTVIKAAAMVHYAARRYDEAIELHRRALGIAPGIPGSHAWIGSALLQKGNVGGAEEACRSERFALLRAPCLAIALRKSGDMAAAEAAMVELLREYGDAGLYQQAQVLAQGGNADAALAALRRAYSLGDAGLNYLQMDPMLDPLRQRADFIALQEQLGFG